MWGCEPTYLLRVGKHIRGNIQIDYTTQYTCFSSNQQMMWYVDREDV